MIKLRKGERGWELGTRFSRPVHQSAKGEMAQTSTSEVMPWTEMEKGDLLGAGEQCSVCSVLVDCRCREFAGLSMSRVYRLSMSMLGFVPQERWGIEIPSRDSLWIWRAWTLRWVERLWRWLDTPPNNDSGIVSECCCREEENLERKVGVGD